MKYLGFLIFIGLTITGCSHPEDHIQKANLSIKKAYDAQTQNNKKEYNEYLSAARKYSDKLFNKSISSPSNAAFCNQIFWDDTNIRTKIKTLELREKLKYYANEKNPDIGLISVYREALTITPSYFNDIKSIRTTLQQRSCRNVIVKEDYLSTIKDLDKARDEIGLSYSRITPTPALTIKAEIQRLDALDQAYRRSNTWDLLNEQEKAQLSGFDRKVQTCINTALSGNSGTNGVHNIIYDTAQLCKQGLH